MSFFDDSANNMLSCVLLLDVSMSMMTNIAPDFKRLDALNAGLHVFQTEIQDDVYAREHVDVALMTFGSNIEVVQDWIIAKDLSVPTLKANGSTPLAEAFVNAVDMCEKRKAHYIKDGIDYYRPWIIIISDGQPTSSPDVWKRAVNTATEVRDKKKAFVTCVAIDGCPTDKLKQLSASPEMTCELSSHSFKEFFQWLSKSIGESSKSGEDLEQGFTPLKL